MKTPEQRYLDLLVKTLSFSLWPNPPVPMEMFDYTRAPYKRKMISLLSKLIRPYKMKLVHDQNFGEDEVLEGKTWPGYADSMIGVKRLNNIRVCAEMAIQQQVPGDFIETGVWRGGACILMRAVLAAYKIQDRRVFVADSFQGLPEPDLNKYPQDQDSQFHTHPYLAVSQEEVAHNFSRYDLLDDQVVFLKGWFSETLPKAPIQQLALLRLDGDMYGSTMDALAALYPKLSPGGFCLIDDYALPGCKAAVDDYRQANAIAAEIIPVDWTGVFWQK